MYHHMYGPKPQGQEEKRALPWTPSILGIPPIASWVLGGKLRAA